jgi:heptosyltransferase-3
MGKPRFLILRGGAIGDFMMTLPALEALRRRWPACHIEVLGYPHIASLARAGGLADAVQSLDKASVALLFVPEQPLPTELALFIRSFDVIINYLYDPDDSVRASLERAGARQVLGITPRLGGVPAARHFMKPLEELAVFPEEEPYPRLVLKPEGVARGRERLAAWDGRVVVVHPGSGSETKNWPLAGFVRVAERVKARGFAPVFSFGEADVELRRSFDRLKTGFGVLPPADLIGLAETFAASCGYLGNDSGVTHVAAAVGIPVTVLFGPSDPGLWASRAPVVRVVRSAQPTTESLAALSVETVWDAVTQMLNHVEPLNR